MLFNLGLISKGLTKWWTKVDHDKHIFFAKSYFSLHAIPNLEFLACYMK